jgi:hypothetical protein
MPSLPFVVLSGCQPFFQYAKLSLTLGDGENLSNYTEFSLQVRLRCDDDPKRALNSISEGNKVNELC